MGGGISRCSPRPFLLPQEWAGLGLQDLAQESSLGAATSLS